jgi:hypothetical protein
MTTPVASSTPPVEGYRFDYAAICDDCGQGILWWLTPDYASSPHDHDGTLHDETCNGRCPHCGGDAGLNWFDRSICPDPCGYMHQRCQGCGHAQEDCAWE